MGCCCSKNKDKDGRLLEKGSFDYGDYLSTNKNKTQYVRIDDDDNIDQLPNLTTIDGFNKNVKNRSRQSSSNNSLTNNSLTNSINNSLIDIDWKPSILKTYKIEYKSLIDFSNKELLILLELYFEYYNNNNNQNKLNNKYGYDSFISLYNWYEKDNKKGGQDEKLKRIKEFSLNNNIWQLPIDIINYFNEYYINKNNINIANDNKYKYYILKMKEIILINSSLLNNISIISINGIKMYYKIYYPLNKLYMTRIPLLLISEYGQCKEDWLLLPQLLSLNRIIITYDMRGIGQTGISTSSSLQNNYSIDLLSSDIAGLIEKLSYKKIFILGNGILGGIIAQTLCIRFQYLINGLILINTLIPNNNQPKNIYISKYNQTYSQFKTKLNNLNKNKTKKNKNDCIHIGCVESITLINKNNNQEEKKEEGEMDMNKMLLYDYYYPFDQKNKYKIYSFIMECNTNNILPFGPFNTIGGNIPFSLLNRPQNGIIAQQNGFIKLLSTKTNVISSRINEIKEPTMIISGKKNIIIPTECTQYLSSKLINVPNELKEIHILDDIGHLWWISHANKCVDIINKFIFKIERNLLIRYDIIINNINNIQTNNGLNDEFILIINSNSFITDEKQQCKHIYEISFNNNNINDINNMCLKFVCLMSDLGNEKFNIKIKNKNDEKIIGIGECGLTEAYNVNTIVNVNEYLNVNIKHGWNKYEYQKRLNDNDKHVTPNGYNNTPYGDDIQPDDDNQRQRLDTDDLDGLDL